MPYVADPTNDSQPSEIETLESAAAEFRAIKRYIRVGVLAGTQALYDEMVLVRDAMLAAANTATALVNFAGAWSGLTGALAVPASVSHNDDIWELNYDVADVTAEEPGVSAAWQLVRTTSAQITHGSQTVYDALTKNPVSGWNNPVVNGRMRVAQDQTTYVAAAQNSYILDQWQYGGSGTAVVTASRTADGPDDSPYCLGLQVTTAQAVLGANDFAEFKQPIEGYNIAHLVEKPMFVRFRVKSNKIGKYAAVLRNGGASFAFVHSFNVTAIDTWETITFPVPDGLPSDAGVTWHSGNNVGLFLRIVCAAGSSLLTATENAWQAAAVLGGIGMSNLLDTIGNYMKITDLEIGNSDVGQASEVIPYEQELERCRRYWRKSLPLVGAATGAGTITFALGLDATSMRTTAPTIGLNNGSGAILEPLVGSRDLTGFSAASPEYIDGTSAGLTTGKTYILKAGRLTYSARI